MVETPEIAATAPATERTPKRVLRLGVGWRHVAIGNLIDMLVTGTTFYSFGLFIRPVAAELGLGRAAINGGLLAMRVGAAVSSPFLGYLVDRYPAKWLVRATGMALGVSFVTIGITHSVWLMALCLTAPVGLSIAMMVLTVPVIAARWFTTGRSRAITLSGLGKSLAGLSVLPIMAYLVGAHGWRPALIMAGVAVCGLMWLISMFVIEPPGALHRPKAKPVPLREKTDKGLDHEGEARWGAKDLLRNRDFWALSFAIAVFLGVDAAVLATVIPYVQDRGFSIAQATSVVTLKTASAIGGKLIVAWFADKVDLRLLLGAVGFLSSILCLTLSLDPSYGVLMAVGSVTGVAIGGAYPVSNALIAARFGVPSLGLAHGLMVPLGAAIGGALLMLSGAAYDAYGNYHLAFKVFIAADFLGVGALLLMKPLRSSTQGHGS